jgi:hypothetical protein
MASKICIKCHIKKEETEYYVHSKQTMRRRNICIDCSQRQKKIYKAENREEINKKNRLYMEKYWVENKEKMVEYVRKYRERNPYIHEPKRDYNHKCKECKKKFITQRWDSVYCSIECNRSAKKRREYGRNEGNWEWYFKGLLHGRVDRKNIKSKDLLKILKKQDYKCALSGVKLTCVKIYGDTNITWTNASIDRIIAGKEYNINNIQLVCRALNSFRGVLPVKEYIDWCKKVTENAIRKQKEATQKRIQAATRKGRT